MHKRLQTSCQTMGTFNHASHVIFPRSDNYYVCVCVCVCVHVCMCMRACACVQPKFQRPIILSLASSGSQMILKSARVGRLHAWRA